MPDFHEMRRTLREHNARIGSLTGVPCPNASCFGTIRRVRDRLVCESCATVRPGH